MILRHHFLRSPHPCRPLAVFSLWYSVLVGKMQTEVNFVWFTGAMLHVHLHLLSTQRENQSHRKISCLAHSTCRNTTQAYATYIQTSANVSLPCHFKQYSNHFLRVATTQWMTVSTCLNSYGYANRYLDDKVDADTLKNVVLHSEATALASIVFPVPGGPNISTPEVNAGLNTYTGATQAGLPFHGRRIPLKKPGIHEGSTQASCHSFTAHYKQILFPPYM